MLGITEVGIDVGKEMLEVHLRRPSGKQEVFETPNEPKGHQTLIKRLTRRQGQARVAMEATGVYHLEPALALESADGIEIMVVNPRMARDFARASTQRSKTDKLDATVLLEFVRRMPFQAWIAPSSTELELRTIARRIASQTKNRTQEKNRCHANGYLACEAVDDDIELNIRHLARQIKALEAKAFELICQCPKLHKKFVRLTSIRGIGKASAIQILGEICILPKDMTPRQWVAHAGLDPRILQSGLSLNAPARISRMGNRNLRAALFMPALVAIKHEPNVRAFYEKLIGNQKVAMQAVVAVMRKLLHSIHGMLQTDTNFDGAKFYAMG